MAAVPSFESAVMGQLIAIEGIDGSGKGTQSARLTRALAERGLRTALLQFPRYSATAFGTAIGEFLNGQFGALDDVHPQLASVLYAGDRFESKPLLSSLQSENDVVVLDRFVGSNLAHQGARLEGDRRRRLIDWIERIEFGVFGLPQADLTILIDLSTAWSRELVGRKPARDYTSRTADLLEADSSYLERVRGCYLEIAAERRNWFVVSGMTPQGDLRTVDDTGDEILRIVLPTIESRRP